MTSDPRAFLALDLGGATTSVALIGRLAHRWRLVGAVSMPAATPADAIALELVRRVVASDPGLAVAIGLPATPDQAEAERVIGDLPRLVGRSAPRRNLLAVAASERTLEPVADAARRTGWRTTTATLGGTDALRLTNRILDPRVDVVLAGAGDPPGADERRLLPELAGIVAGAVARRPELTVVLAGAMAEHLGQLEAGEGNGGRPADRPGELLLAPAATAGDPPGTPLRELLDEVRGGPDDPRRAAGRWSTPAGLQRPAKRAPTQARMSAIAPSSIPVAAP